MQEKILEFLQLLCEIIAGARKHPSSKSDAEKMARLTELSAGLDEFLATAGAISTLEEWVYLLTIRNDGSAWEDLIDAAKAALGQENIIPKLQSLRPRRLPRPRDYAR